jgi:hypothetical protein
VRAAWSLPKSAACALSCRTQAFESGGRKTRKPTDPSFVHTSTISWRRFRSTQRSSPRPPNKLLQLMSSVPA